MTSAKQLALNAAKEIVVARVGPSSVFVNKEGGERVAEFYEAIYKKIFELATLTED